MGGNNEWEAVDSLIGPGCRVEGTIVFRGGLRVDGEVCGDVVGETGDLLLSPRASVKGALRVRHVAVAGELFGDLHASGRVELLPRARIIGNIHYTSLTMQAGACVAGKLCPIGEPPSAAAGANSYNRGSMVQQAGALT